jgi:hypothetical protein
VGPLLASPDLRQLFGWLTHPLPSLVLFTIATWFWHVPRVYELALRSNGWHYVQHLSFLGTALLFWYPVIRPYPTRPRWSMWLLLPALLFADLSNTVLSAVLTFSDTPLYPYYTEVPRLGGQSALDDQVAAGVFMWVPGSIAFLLPLFSIGFRLLSSGEKATRPQPRPTRISLTLLPSSTAEVHPARCHATTPSAPDLLRAPVLGRFLKWRHARLCLQLPLLILAAVVIYDGITGPRVAAMNLAGVLPWIHWRGLLILGLLAAGNVFCMGCPFVVPRTLAQRWLPRGWTWPRWLRNKWPAVFLIGIFLWAYEALALWDRPLWTAWIALGYFIAAFVIDGLFRGANFCKYLCPIGQFNFVQALASPLEVKALDPAVCASCQTKDCIRGARGCELHLFVPRKAGNMDCTFCLDCVHSCPHDNVGLIVGTPAAELAGDRQRSGIGRFSRRPDIAALIVVLVFGAFANAAGMVGPVADALDQIAQIVEFHSPLLAITVFYLIALVALPLVLVAGAAGLSRWWGRLQDGTLTIATHYAYALVPLGMGMWLAHYSYHFLTSFDTVVPVVQRFALDLGLTGLGPPAWEFACCRPPTTWLLPLELVFLDVGLLFSLYTGYRLAPTVRALVPWALLQLLLFVLGVWILFQPMQMRGTLM